MQILYFFLLTNYSNYVVFDEALVLLDQLKKAEVFCSMILAFGNGGPRTPIAFKVEFTVTKVNGWMLLL